MTFAADRLDLTGKSLGARVRFSDGRGWRKGPPTYFGLRSGFPTEYRVLEPWKVGTRKCLPIVGLSHARLFDLTFVFLYDPSSHAVRMLAESLRDANPSRADRGVFVEWSDAHWLHRMGEEGFSYRRTWRLDRRRTKLVLGSWIKGE